MKLQFIVLILISHFSGTIYAGQICTSEYEKALKEPLDIGSVIVFNSNNVLTNESNEKRYMKLYNSPIDADWLDYFRRSNKQATILLNVKKDHEFVVEQGDELVVKNHVFGENAYTVLVSTSGNEYNMYCKTRAISHYNDRTFLCTKEYFVKVSRVPMNFNVDKIIKESDYPAPECVDREQQRL